MLVPLTLFAYIGPETLMPLASLLAAALGIVLAFWRYIKRYSIDVIVRLFQSMRGK